MVWLYIYIYIWYGMVIYIYIYLIWFYGYATSFDRALSRTHFFAHLFAYQPCIGQQEIVPHFFILNYFALLNLPDIRHTQIHRYIYIYIYIYIY